MRRPPWVRNVGIYGGQISPRRMGAGVGGRLAPITSNIERRTTSPIPSIGLQMRHRIPTPTGVPVTPQIPTSIESQIEPRVSMETTPIFRPQTPTPMFRPQTPTPIRPPFEQQTVTPIESQIEPRTPTPIESQVPKTPTPIEKPWTEPSSWGWVRQQWTMYKNMFGPNTPLPPQFSQMSPLESGVAYFPSWGFLSLRSTKFEKGLKQECRPGMTGLDYLKQKYGDEVAWQIIEIGSQNPSQWIKQFEQPGPNIATEPPGPSKPQISGPFGPRAPIRYGGG